MTEKEKKDIESQGNQSSSSEEITVQSSRFGEFVVKKETVINFPRGLIGFPNHKDYIMLEYKNPFAWLQSVDDPNLAFVVIDGFEFGENYQVKPPYGDKDCGFVEGEEYAILVIVTVRPDPSQTTANLKAPLFVNLQNRKGVQVIFDSPHLSTRFPLWSESDNDNKDSSDKSGVSEDSSKEKIDEKKSQEEE